MLSIAKRNLKIFFRDKAAVFFSFLGVIIVIGLYILFLGDTLIGAFDKLNNARQLMDAWIMGGVVAITAVTTTMGAFGIMVQDKMNKTIRDFLSAPIKRYKISGGYLLSAFIIGVVTSLFSFALAEIFIVAKGGEVLSAINIFKMFGVILLNTFTSTAIVFFIVSLFKSNNAFAAASTVIGTLIGFITGTYIPIGQLPESVGWVVKLFPISNSSFLMRQIMTENQLETAFSSVPDSIRIEAIEEFKELMGITATYGDVVISPIVHILILLITGIVFFGWSVVVISRKQK